MLNALIFAAGLGTRMGSITTSIPKALVPVNGQPLLMHAINKVVETGANKIVINTHHHSQQIKEFIQTIKIENVELLISDETDQLLDTGGGLLNAAPLFNNSAPILMYNSDVITGVDLKSMLNFHTKMKNSATLMVKDRSTTRYFLFDNTDRLCGWENINTNEQKIVIPSPSLQRQAFSGIHLINQDILPLLGETRKFSIIEGYLNIAKNCVIAGWKNWDKYWYDVGTPDKLEIAEKHLSTL